MTLQEVLIGLASGNRLRKNFWKDNEYIHIFEGCLCNQEGELVKPTFEEGPEWEVYNPVLLSTKEVMDYLVRGGRVRLKYANSGFLCLSEKGKLVDQDSNPTSLLFSDDTSCIQYVKVTTQI